MTISEPEKGSSFNAFGDDPVPVAPCKCGYHWHGGLLPEEVCHRGGGEYIVVCPHCRNDGELKATPLWAVEAWNAKMTISEPCDELVLKVAKEIERVFYEAVDRGDMRGPQAFEHVARAAIAAMPELTELQQRVKQLEEGLRLGIPLIEEEREITVSSNAILYTKHPRIGEVIDPDAIELIESFDEFLNAARTALTHGHQG